MATRAPTTVTPAAIPIVLRMMVRYAALPKIRRKLPTFQTRSMAVVNSLMRQNAVMSRTASDPMYTKTNQASGGVRRSASRARGRRHSAAAARLAIPTGGPSTVCVATRSSRPLARHLGVPRLDPLRVRHAVRLAVPAVGQRRLPQLDRLEVLQRGVGMVLRARALRQLVHDRARQLVVRGLTVRDRLQRLGMRL